jgi:hypothetical protein
MRNAELAITLLLGLLDRANAISQLISTARTEGRDISDEELNKLQADDDVAREKLLAAIKAGG